MDGGDGGPAAVLVTGTGGDLFQMVALLNTGLVQPAQLQMTQLYKLEPGKHYVDDRDDDQEHVDAARTRSRTSIRRSSAISSRASSRTCRSLQLSVPLGQLPLFGGEQTIFTPGAAGFNVRFAIEDSYKMAGGFPGFPGMVVDYVATRGKGVSYGLAVPDSDDNYVNKYASQYPGQTVTAHSMLLPFTYAGVTGAYMYEPPATMQPNEERTYTSYFVVGRGDVASVYDTILETRKAADRHVRRPRDRPALRRRRSPARA